MKKVLLLFMTFLLLPLALLADDDIVFVEGERRIFVRLEFEDERTELTEASAAAFAEVAPMFRDGVIRRYELHGNFCANIRGSRRNAVLRTETVFQKLVDNGVNAARITTTINVATPTPRQSGGLECTHERRVDIMSIDIRPERRSVAQIAEEPPALVAPIVPVDEPAVPTTPTAPIQDVARNVPSVAPTTPTPSAPSTPSTTTQAPRTVAVYMAGTEPAAVRGVHNILGGELTRTISANENFIAVDRTDFILAALEDEHEYQRSGMVDDEQIKDLGRQLGVEFMCISNIMSVGNGYYIDTRLVDVVTAEVIRSITATSSLRDAAEKMRVARDIALELVDPDRANRCGAGDDTRYDPAHQFCFGGRAYNLCAGSGYNPQTQGCLPNQEIGTLCSDGSVVALGTHCGEHALSVAVAPVNGGTIIRAPDAPTYRADATVALSAVANRGFTFAGWAGAQTSSDQSINITMTRNMPVIAMFRPENNNALITTAFPANGGTITRSPESDVYQSGEVVRVTATPSRGFEFVKWEGATSETSPTINIMIDEGKTLVAIFRPNLHTLNATAMPQFGGSVFIDGTALAEASSAEFGNLVEMFARPAPGYVFTGWTGAAFGNENPVIVDLTFGNVNVIANFAPVQININDENVSRVIAVSGGAPMPVATREPVAQTVVRATVANAPINASGSSRRNTSVGISGAFRNNFTNNDLEYYSVHDNEPNVDWLGGGFNMFLMNRNLEFNLGMTFFRYQRDDEYSFSSNKLTLSFSSFDIGVFGKYPIDIGGMTLSPMVGPDLQVVFTGKVTNEDDLSQIQTTNDLHKPYNYTRAWLKFGFSMESNHAGPIFLRPQILYGVGFGLGESNRDTERFSHGFDIRFGVGYRF